MPSHPDNGDCTTEKSANCDRPVVTTPPPVISAEIKTQPARRTHPKAWIGHVREPAWFRLALMGSLSINRESKVGQRWRRSRLTIQAVHNMSTSDPYNHDRVAKPSPSYALPEGHESHRPQQPPEAP